MLIGVRRAPPVHPIERQYRRVLNRNSLGRPAQAFDHPVSDRPELPGTKFADRPQQKIPEPGIQITERRLSGLERHHGSVHLTAYATDRGRGQLVGRTYQDIAGGGAHDPGQDMGLDTGSDSPGMGIDHAYTHHRTFRQTQPPGVFGRNHADRAVGRNGFTPETVAPPLQQRVKCSQEGFGGQTVPGLMPHGLVSGRATVPQHLLGTRLAGKQRTHPVRMFNPGIGGTPHPGIAPQHMQNLRPGPLRRIGSSGIGREIDVPPMGQRVDLPRFVLGRMVFPQNEHRIRIVCKSGAERQRHSRPVGKHRSAPGRIERNGPDLSELIRPHPVQKIPHGRLEGFDIVQRMLPVAVGKGIAIQPLFPSGIGGYGNGRHIPRSGIDEQRPTGVGAEIDADHIVFSSFRDHISDRLRVRRKQQRRMPRPEPNRPKRCFRPGPTRSPEFASKRLLQQWP